MMQTSALTYSDIMREIGDLVESLKNTYIENNFWENDNHNPLLVSKILDFFEKNVKDE